MESVDERRLGGGSERRAKVAGKRLRDSKCSAERVARSVGRLPRDLGREQLGELRAVHRDTDAAEDRDSERTAQLAARLRRPVAAPACSGGALPTMSSVASVITGANPSEITTDAAAMSNRLPPPSTESPRSIAVPAAAMAMPTPMITDGRKR